jgi:polyisoprenyl-teichoic acid--peptidoglycan teichoic acid transferase
MEMPENELDDLPTIRASVAPSAPDDKKAQTTSTSNRTVRSTAVITADNVYRNPLNPSPPPPPSLTRESSVRERARRRQTTPRRKGGEWAWVVIAAAMLGVAVMVSLSMFIVLRMSQEQPEILPTAQVAFSALPTPVDFRGDGKGGPGALVFSDGTKVELKPWDGESRMTILLIGLDRRPQEKGLGYRTDTLLLISLNPKDNTVGILSVPRDLYIDVPGFYGMHRINEPMVLGELREPGYGPRLLMETIQSNLNMRVDNYIIVDFKAFIGIVDALGGIDIEIDYNISDPSYPSMNYGYEAFYLKAGKHTLDGNTALKFARTRHGDNDFRRAERQQMVLYAIRDKVSRPDVLPRMLTQAPLIWDSLRDNVYTGLTLDQLVQIGLYIKDVPNENIRKDVIDYKYAVPFTTPGGAQVLLPNNAKIAVLMAEVFGADYVQ